MLPISFILLHSHSCVLCIKAFQFIPIAVSLDLNNQCEAYAVYHFVPSLPVEPILGNSLGKLHSLYVSRLPLDFLGDINILTEEEIPDGFHLVYGLHNCNVLLMSIFWFCFLYI